MTEKLKLDYYSDILCVWAWVAQRRIEELLHEFGDRVELDFHYIDIFGDVVGKVRTQWHGKGFYEGFAEHVMHSVAEYEHVEVNSNIWKSVRPTTSANAHLILKATELVDRAHTSQQLALNIRRAFFIEAQDISKLQILMGIAEKQNLDINKLEKTIDSGAAIAALLQDYQQAKKQMIKGSPSYVLNSGRQTLYGNVGYRVLQANVEELLLRPEEEASWC